MFFDLEPEEGFDLAEQQRFLFEQEYLDEQFEGVEQMQSDWDALSQQPEYPE